MPVQGAGQSFRDQFSVPGMSQVLILDFFFLCELGLFLCQLSLGIHLCFDYIRTSWVMTSRAKDLMFLIM